MTVAMPIKTALAIIRRLGMKAGHRDGEYRVNYPGGTEATAYYTTDADDAIGTATEMVKRMPD